MSKRTLFFFSILLVFVLAITGCDKKDKAADTGKAKDTLNIGFFAEPSTLDCIEGNDEASRIVAYQIYEYLIREQPDNTLGPGLAERWTFSPDGTEITFYLRKGVKFHNGDVMTADDVVFSLNRAIQSDFTSRVTTTMDSARKVDDHTVILKLKHAFGPIEQCLATAQMGIFNKKAFEADPNSYKRNPIGTGPYKFVEWRTGERVVLEAFEDYFLGEAPIKNVIFKIIPDDNTRTIALEKGEIDFAHPASLEDRHVIRDNPDLIFYDFESPAITYVAFNMKDEIFSNKKVRQAIAHAIDKEAMILGVVDGSGTVLEAPINKNAFGYPHDFVNRQYDVAKAKQLMIEAGYPNGFKTQICTSDTEYYRKRAEMLQDQLKVIGIDLEIQSLEWGTFVDAVLGQRNYKITTMTLSTPYQDADHIYELYHSTMITRGRNFVMVENPVIDDLLDRARYSNDNAERERLYRELSDLWYDEVITFPLYMDERGSAAHKDLKGVNLNTLITEFNYYYTSW